MQSARSRQDLNTKEQAQQIAIELREAKERLSFTERKYEQEVKDHEDYKKITAGELQRLERQVLESAAAEKSAANM